MRDTFILYSEWWQHIRKLSDEQRGQLLSAIYAHAIGDAVPALDIGTDMCFSFIRACLDKDAAEYERRCEANRKNGSKGGRPPKGGIGEDRGGASQNPAKPNKANGFSENPRKHEYDNESDDGYDSTFEEDEAIDAEYIGRGRTREDLPLPPETPDETEQEFLDADDIVRAAYRDAFGRCPTNEEVRRLSLMAVGFGKTELIGEAIRRAAQNGARTVWKYVARIIDEWRLQSIDTMAELDEYDRLRAIAEREITDPVLDPEGALAQIRENRESKCIPTARASP